MVKEVAFLREKSIETENVIIFSEIRDRIRAKWGLSKQISLTGSNLEKFLSKETKSNIEKI